MCFLRNTGRYSSGICCCAVVLVRLRSETEHPPLVDVGFVDGGVSGGLPSAEVIHSSLQLNSETSHT